MEKRVTLQQVQDVFDSFLLLGDKDYITLTLANIIGNQMAGRRPIWTMLVAPPSSGKTTVLNALVGLKVFNSDGEAMQPIHSISDLTENSFASGMQRSEKETSLLHKIPHGGVMVFKDFTSILSKRGEAKTVIMGQLREIYDGSYVKRTGTGEDIAWTGKIGAIAGVTEAIYQHLESMSVMGDRFMLYQIPQPDRKDMLRFKLRQELLGITEATQMPYAQEIVHQYIQQAMRELEPTKIYLPESAQEDIIQVADFCTIVRSGIIVNDYTGKIQFVPQPEMPARMFEQMIALGSTLAFMRKMDNPKLSNEKALQPADFKVMYKIAFDSIPVTRRIALHYLAKYSNGVAAGALAAKVNYPTDVVRTWLEQLNALGVVKRLKKGVGADWWALEDEYLPVMIKLEGTRVLDEALVDDDIDSNEVERHWDSDKSPSIDEMMEIEANTKEW
jgi:hypothetical protein